MTLNSLVNFNLPDTSAEERFRVIVFRRYLGIIFLIFSLALAFEIIVDFVSFDRWSFLSVQLTCILFYCLSILKIKHRLVLWMNFVFMLVSNQIAFLSHPQSLHVLVFWIGLAPLFIAVLVDVKETLLWTGVYILFIIGNGSYLSYAVGPYPVTIDPNRFLTGGIVFMLTTSLLAALFGITQKRIREKLYKQNLKLSELAEEIKTTNQQLKDYNEHLEERVYKRTEELEHQNKQLTEYAYINSHLLRGPLARIMGITNLLAKSATTEEQKKYIEHLTTASDELDDVIGKINKALRQEGKFSRDEIQRLKQN
jgi:signal transduction histidine kinase